MIVRQNPISDNISTEVDDLLPQKRIAEQKLKKTEELAKAELAAKLASEKAAQIEKIAEANLHVRST